MCDPITGLAIAGTVVAMAGSIGAGIQGQQQAEYNAQVAQSTAAFEEDRSRDRARRLLAMQRVGFAKAGVTLEGTPTDVLADTAAQAEIDALAIRWGGAQRAAAFKAQGQEALVGGIAGAGGALLTGVTSFGESLLKPGTSK